MRNSLKYLNRCVNKLKKVISHELNHGHYESAMTALSACGGLLYQANQYYSDDTLESAISKIASILPKLPENLSSREKR